MTQREFIDRLQQGLQHLPPGELADTLQFYREAIADRIEEGFSEEQAVRDLGDVEAIIANYPQGKRKAPAKIWKTPASVKLGGCLALIIAGPIVFGVLILVGCILFSVAVTVSAAILLMLPLILVSAVGALLGWVFHRRGGFRRPSHNGVAVAQAFDPDLNAIDFTDINTELEVSTSPDGQIHLDYQESALKKYTVGIIDQVLKIKGESRRSVDPVGIFSILLPADFHGNLQIKADNGIVSGSAPGRLDTVGVMLDNGKISLTGITTAGSLTAELDNGKISLQTIDCAHDLCVRGSNGKAELSLVHADGNLEVSFDNGKINVERISAAKMIRLQSKLGTIAGTVAESAASYQAPTAIRSCGTWGLPPKQLEIKLKLGKVKLEFTE